jgi:hypothetical protein
LQFTPLTRIEQKNANGECENMEQCKVRPTWNWLAEGLVQSRNNISRTAEVLEVVPGRFAVKPSVINVDTRLPV